MFEKLKKYLIIPAAFLAGFIYYLLGKNRALEDKLDESQAKAELEKSKVEQEKIDAQAKDSVDAYTAARDEYIKNHPGGSDKP